jgi:hypothetical protein
MALKATYDIRCSCGASFAADVYEYVFAEHDPDLKDAILSGEFNRVSCPSCGERLPIENRFLYRDEGNRLWVWVCGKEEEPDREALVKELIQENTFMEWHHLDDKDDYAKFLVFGRDGLIGLLLNEDRGLKKIEGKRLKKNPALRWIPEGKEGAGHLWLRGGKITISMPLRLPADHKRSLPGPEEKRKWLRHYSHGLNIHNPYSTFLSPRQKIRWEKIREKEPLGDPKNGFDDFAESWAGYRIDPKRFQTRYPERRAFFDGLRKLNIPRKLHTLNPGRIPRETGGRRP